MALRLNRSRVASVAVASVALTAAVSGAYATSAANDEDSVVNACYRLKTGDLRLESAKSPCATDADKWRLREKRISWNEEGLPGADGLAGADGVDGQNGVDGKDGAPGQDGAPGIDGARGPMGPAGPAGPIGLTGLMGLPGLDGKDGADGTNGKDGANGVDGEAGATGPQGPKGEPGQDGKDGAQGPAGPAGPTGATGATGPAGPQGETGPQGPAGSGGFELVDADGVTLGDLMSIDRNSFTLLTSTGYLLTARWDGTIPTSQTYYTGADCTGTPYLNSSGGIPAFGKTLVYLGSPGSLGVPDVTGAGAAPAVSLTAESIDNPACGPSTGTKTGVKMKTTTAVAVGLPAGTTNQLVTPLSIN